MGMLYHCPVDGRTVLFDVTGDRYFLVPEPLQGAFDRWLADEAAPLPNFLEPLLAKRRSTARPVRAAPVPKASCALERGARRPIFSRLLATLRWWRIMAQVRSELANLGLAASIARVRAEKLSIATPRDPRPFARQLRGDQNDRLISGDCLTQSLAMMCALHRQRSTATLVFGVTLAPFRAHCWVQHENCVLNDEADSVASYRPIFTL